MVFLSKVIIIFSKYIFQNRELLITFFSKFKCTRLETRVLDQTLLTQTSKKSSRDYHTKTYLALIQLRFGQFLLFFSLAQLISKKTPTVRTI